MSKLIRVAPNKYSFETDSGTLFYGTTEEVSQVMRKAYGFSSNTLGDAFMEFHNKAHNVAEFGIYKTLLFTEYRPMSIQDRTELFMSTLSRKVH